MFRFIKSPKEYNDPDDLVTIEFQVHNDNIGRNELLLHFISFLKACGYSVCDREMVDIIEDEFE